MALTTRLPIDAARRLTDRGLLRELWMARWAYFFIAPLMLIFLIFVIAPLLYGIYISLFDVRFGLDWVFVGLSNYADALRDPILWNALQVTGTFVVVLVPVSISVYLALAVLIVRTPAAAQTFYKSSFYLPAVISAVVLSVIWWWIFNPTYGLANYALTLFGLEPIPWIARPTPAVIAVIVMVVASGGGSAVVMYTAALGGIPASLYESAEIDGASGWARFWNVTLPLLRPTTLYLLVMSTIGNFQIFTQVFILTYGGPARATETIAMLIYNMAFQRNLLGPAAATSILLFGVIALVAAGLFRSFSTDVEY